MFIRSTFKENYVILHAIIDKKNCCLNDVFVDQNSENSSYSPMFIRSISQSHRQRKV